MTVRALLGVIGMGGLGFVAWVAVTLLPRPDLGTSGRLYFGLGIIGMTAFSMALLLAMFRYVTVDDTGVSTVGPFRRKHWPWSEIRDAGLKSDTSVTVTPFLTLHSGRHVWLRAANGYGILRAPAHVEDMVAVIYEHLQRHVGPAQPSRS